MLVAAQVKPTYLLLLAFPLLLAPRQIPRCLFIVGGTAAALGADRIFLPDLYAEFLQALDHQMRGTGDLGQGVFGIVCQLFAPRGVPPTAMAAWTAMLVEAAFLAVLAGVSRRLRPATVIQGEERVLRVAWITIAVVVGNPRMMVYDICLAAIPFCRPGAGAAARGRPAASRLRAGDRCRRRIGGGAPVGAASAGAGPVRRLGGRRDPARPRRNDSARRGSRDAVDIRRGQSSPGRTMTLHWCVR